MTPTFLGLAALVVVVLTLELVILLRSGEDEP
jgi:hypothetical protein